MLAVPKVFDYEQKFKDILTMLTSYTSDSRSRLSLILSSLRAIAKSKDRTEVYPRSTSLSLLPFAVEKFEMGPNLLSVLKRESSERLL